MSVFCTPDGQSSLTTEYALGYIYENGNLQFFSTPEGYVAAEPNDEFKYVYQYKDHLGNVRLSYTDDPSNLGTAVIIEENNYYPFGLQHKGYNMGGDNALGNDLAQKWKFGGKELDESLNGILSTYDFGARNYDPAIGRWMNIDPLSEKMRRHSPYNYAFDNPIFYIDPDGMEAYASNGYQDLDENEAFVSGAQVLKAGEGSVNITHTDSNGNKSTSSVSSSDYNHIINQNKPNDWFVNKKTGEVVHDRNKKKGDEHLLGEDFEYLAQEDEINFLIGIDNLNVRYFNSRYDENKEENHLTLVYDLESSVRLMEHNGRMLVPREKITTTIRNTTGSAILPTGGSLSIVNSSISEVWFNLTYVPENYNINYDNLNVRSLTLEKFGTVRSVTENIMSYHRPGWGSNLLGVSSTVGKFYNTMISGDLSTGYKEFKFKIGTK